MEFIIKLIIFSTWVLWTSFCISKAVRHFNRAEYFRFSIYSSLTYSMFIFWIKYQGPLNIFINNNIMSK